MTINGLEAKLLAKNGKIAEIEIEGQKVNINSEFLPQTLKVGESANLYFMSSKEAGADEKKLAKAILEEILNGK